jgi:hypothetical protein
LSDGYGVAFHSHNREEVESLLRAYNRILYVERYLDEHKMEEGQDKRKDQFRLLPVYSKDNQFKRCLSI